MKNIFLLLLLVSFISFSQENVQPDFNTQNLYPLPSWNQSLDQGVSGLEEVKYLFDDWENTGIIETDSNEKLRVRNFNYDIQNNVFVSKVVNSDSIYYLNNDVLRSVYINNVNYKVITVKGSQKIVEVVAESNKGTLFKEYDLSIKSTFFTYSDTQKKDSYVVSSKYFFKEKEIIKPLRLTKSKFFKIFKNKSSEIKLFVKENKLSFKKEEDLKKIFLFYKNL